MSFLVVLKRFEVWLLFAVVAAVLWIAFMPVDSPPPVPPVVGVATSGDSATGSTPTSEEPESPPSLAVREVRVLASEGGRIVETILSGSSPTGSDLALDESTVRATTPTGEPVPRFFEPFREPALLARAANSEATLRWWLTSPTDELWLEVSGIRLRAGLGTTPP